MTGLYNSRYFEQMLFETITESVTTGKPMTIAISDIDHFKKFNDSNGHALGDEVLKHVARLFSECVRPDTDDMVFRYGGEEFCMLMPNTTPEEAMEVIENYRARLDATPLEHMGSNLKVQVSVGLATSIIDATDSKQLFEHADESLYACKHNGRNQIRHYANGSKIRYQPSGLAELIEQAYK
jgi:diguanylate cyclase (GGDEF)-like protein